MFELSSIPFTQQTSRALRSNARQAISLRSPAYRNRGGEGVPSARDVVATPSKACECQCLNQPVFSRHYKDQLTEWGLALAPRAQRTATAHWSRPGKLGKSVTDAAGRRRTAHLSCAIELLQISFVKVDSIGEGFDARNVRATGASRGLDVGSIKG
jgi:hypothetical protein